MHTRPSRHVEVPVSSGSNVLPATHRSASPPAAHKPSASSAPLAHCSADNGTPFCLDTQRNRNRSHAASGTQSASRPQGASRFDGEHTPAPIAPLAQSLARFAGAPAATRHTEPAEAPEAHSPPTPELPAGPRGAQRPVSRLMSAARSQMPDAHWAPSAQVRPAGRTTHAVVVSSPAQASRTVSIPAAGSAHAEWYLPIPASPQPVSAGKLADCPSQTAPRPSDVVAARRLTSPTTPPIAVHLTGWASAAGTKVPIATTPMPSASRRTVPIAVVHVGCPPELSRITPVHPPVSSPSSQVAGASRPPLGKSAAEDPLNTPARHTCACAGASHGNVHMPGRSRSAPAPISTHVGRIPHRWISPSPLPSPSEVHRSPPVQSSSLEHRANGLPSSCRGKHRRGWPPAASSSISSSDAEHAPVEGLAVTADLVRHSPMSPVRSETSGMTTRRSLVGHCWSTRSPHDPRLASGGNDVQ